MAQGTANTEGTGRHTLFGNLARIFRDRRAGVNGAGADGSAAPTDGGAQVASDASAADAAAPQAAQAAGAAAGEGFVPACQVFFADGFTQRDEALSYLADRAVELGIAEDAGELVSAFLRREAEGTTGMMDGYAIPHAKSATVKRTAVLVLRSAQGVYGWETMDELPVTVAIALLVPAAQEGATHLKLLAKVAEALMDDGFRASVKAAADERAVAGIVSSYLA